MSHVYNLNDLIQLMARLRDPNDGCPWDVEQSYKTIVPSTIEEAYEVADCIERGDLANLKEELGDLLFQTVFYAQLAAEDGAFDLHTVVSDLTTKLIRRHPHVFPDGTLQSRKGDVVDSAGVLENWEAIKATERTAKGLSGILDDVPLNLPSAARAQKVQKRAARVGFDFDSLEPVLAKVEEELAEVREAAREKDAHAVHEEMGDLLFACINLGRHLKVDSETSLRHATHKFESRFRYIERALAESGEHWDTQTEATLNQLWERAKRAEKNRSEKR